MIKADTGLTGHLFFKAGFSHVTGSGGKQEAGGDFLLFLPSYSECGEARTGLRKKSKVSVAAEESVCEQRRQQTAGEEEQTAVLCSSHSVTVQL